jgi:hypothetical protein
MEEQNVIGKTGTLDRAMAALKEVYPLMPGSDLASQYKISLLGMVQKLRRMNVYLSTLASGIEKMEDKSFTIKYLQEGIEKLNRANAELMALHDSIRRAVAQRYPEEECPLFSQYHSAVVVAKLSEGTDVLVVLMAGFQVERPEALSTFLERICKQLERLVADITA